MALIKSGKKVGFKYQERTSEDMESRQKSFSGRDSYFSKDVKFFITKSGTNKIRILPPTWEDAKHYGHDIFVHYGIGPDNVGYLCLDRMSAEPCPLCEARQEADHTGDEDLAKALRATRRVAVYVIDRGAPAEGPKIWAMPQTVDKEICAQAWEKESGEVLALDHPDEGYDISFTVEGQGQTKKYVGIRLSRRSSPVSDDDKQATAWLEYISEHPIPGELVLHKYNEIKQAFEGQAPAGKEGGEESNKPSTKRPSLTKNKAAATPEKDEGDEEAATPKARPHIGGAKPSVKKKEPAGPTWEEVHEMDEDAIGALASESDIEFVDDEGEEISFDTLAACQDFVCEKLSIENPDAGEVAEEDEEAPPEKPKGKLADRLRSLNKKK